MTYKLKRALGGVRAEDQLKQSTMRYLQNEMQKRNTSHARRPAGRIVIVFASLVVVVLSGVLFQGLYFTPTAYVGVDVNPSIELTLNRFDRVIDAYAYNDDGEGILSGLSVRHKSYDEALTVLMDAIGQKGYMQEGGLVSVTLQTDASSRETGLLASIRSSVTDFINEHHQGTQTDVFSVSDDTQSHAHELNVSPAMYLAIQELLAIDPAATVESCRDHSISELRQLSREYEGNHHVSDNINPTDEPVAGNNGDNEDETCEPGDNEKETRKTGDDMEEMCEPGNEKIQVTEQDSEHHGARWRSSRDSSGYHG